MNKIIVLLAASLSLFGVAQAQDRFPVLSTQELVNTCRINANQESHGFCTGYVSAIYDTYLTTRPVRHMGPFICVKQPAPARDQVIEDFVKFSLAIPEVADKPAAGTFLSFLAMKFPCENK